MTNVSGNTYNASGAAQPSPQFVERSPSAAERLIAALAHLVILLNLPGIFVTAIILLLSRHGSPYVRHHARRAIRLQFFENALTIGLLAIFAAVVVASGMFSKGHSNDSGMALDTAFAAGLGIVGVLVVLVGVETVIFGIPAIFGALRALLTSQFRYPVPRPK